MLLQKKTLAKRTINRSAISSNMLDIRESEGKASIYHTTWMIMGLPGIGKSTLFTGFEGCLYLVTSEKELTNVKVPFILIETWEKLMEVTDELLNNRQKYIQYKFIIVDFVDAVWTLCIVAVCDKLKISHASEAGYGKGTDMIDLAFRKWATQLIASDYGIGFVSHVVTKDVIVSGGSVTKTICSLPIRARNILFPLINVLGCIEYKTVKIMNPIKGKIELVRKRIISFTGSEYVEAKDRDGVLPDEIVLHKNAIINYNTFKEYYDGKRIAKKL